MIAVIRYHDGDRYVTALAREARSRLHLTVIDDCGIRHFAVPGDELRRVAPVLLHGRTYPVPRLIKFFRRIGRERGITAAAKRELDLATRYSGTARSTQAWG
ncbi:MAG: hypothetical protein WDZ66_03940 [Steroidobacteraceae bacterium]